MSKPPRTFPTGEYNEGLEWAIEYDAQFNPKYHAGPLCPHAIRALGNITVPRVIHARNEAGFNSTMVCADCILAALTGEEPT